MRGLLVVLLAMVALPALAEHDGLGSAVWVQPDPEWRTLDRRERDSGNQIETLDAYRIMDDAEAVAVVARSLRRFSREDRARILRAAAVLLGDDQSDCMTPAEWPVLPDEPMRVCASEMGIPDNSVQVSDGEGWYYYWNMNTGEACRPSRS